MYRQISFSDIYCEKNYPDWFSFLSDTMNQPYNQNLLWRGQENADWEITSSYIRQYDTLDKVQLSIDMGKFYFDLLNNMPKAGVAFIPNPLGIFCHHGYYGQFYWKRLFARFKQYRERSIEELSDHIYSYMFGSHYDCSFGFDMDLSLWAWGQHYGLKTPLVDWTRYALYALFFAINQEPKTSQIAVYSLNLNTLINVNDDKIFSKDRTKSWHPQEHEKRIFYFFDHIFIDGMMPSYKHNRDITFQKNEFDDFFTLMRDMSKLKIILPSSSEQNTRLQCQGGVFSFVPGGISTEKWCSLFYQGAKDVYIESESPLLVKHIINFNPDDFVKCTNFLENCNISEKTIALSPWLGLILNQDWCQRV